jgi:DNA polymerase-3 subunit alpha
LKWGKDENIAAILNEIKQLGGVSISQPDINISTDNFETNYQTNEIYWSLLRVKFVGVTAVDFIVSNRKRYGQFTCIEEFIERIFKHKFKKKYQYWDDPDDEVDYERCPVNARMVRNLIVAGAFDKLEHVTEVTQRYDIIVRAAKTLGFEIPEKEVPEDLRDKHWFWSQQQINLSGFGTVDYERIYNNAKLPASMSSYSYFPIELLADINLGERKVGVCATIEEVEEKSYKDKKTGEKKYYGKIILRQNLDAANLVIWNDTWANVKSCFMHKKDSIVIFAGNTKFSDYDEKNILQINKNQFVTNI